MRAIFLAAVAVCLALAGASYAHPPSGIKALYENETKTLKVTVSHPVTNPETHYIDRIEVYLEGDKILEHKLSRQENDAAQYLSYTIPDAEKGDRIRVIIHCNSYGKRLEELKVR
jgi:desulfoferrodoxin (superoxide reductase-like protein)